MKFPRFSLPFLLLFATIAGGAIWWLVDPPKRPVDIEQAEKVGIGFTQEQVRNLVGPPHRHVSQMGVVHWEYDSGSKAAINDSYLEVIFDQSGTAADVRCGGRWLPPDDSRLVGDR